MKKLVIICSTLFAMAPLAYAAVVVGGTAGVGVKTTVVSTQVNTRTTVSVTATSTPVMMREREGTETEGGMMMGGKMEDGMMNEGEGGENGTENAEMHADVHAEYGLETAEFHMDLRTHEEGDAKEESTTAEIDSPMKVHSAHEFEHFVEHKAKADERIKGVDLKDGKIEVEYEESAKLFGFIPMMVNAHATGDAKGTIEVKYPWYHIFMKKKISSASLQSEIARALAAKRMAAKAGIPAGTIEADVEAAFNAPDLFETIADALHGASLKAEAEVSAK